MSMGCTLHNIAAVKAIEHNGAASWLRIDSHDNCHAVVFMPLAQADLMALAFAAFSNPYAARDLVGRLADPLGLIVTEAPMSSLAAELRAATGGKSPAQMEAPNA